MDRQQAQRIAQAMWDAWKHLPDDSAELETLRRFVRTVGPVGDEMKYVGSKSRHAKEILPIMLKGRKPGQYWVEPFVGGGNVIHLVDGPRIGADSHEYLIAMLSAVSDGWKPPHNVSEEIYKRVKENPKEHPKHLVGFIGFGCSYSGKWWGGYARDGKGLRNYAAESARNIEKQASGLSGVVLVHSDYKDLKIPPNSIVYCDPPYANSLGYGSKFDHDEFWRWCNGLINDGHTVFVSEYSAPDDWDCVWQKDVNNTLVQNTGAKKGTERLFTKQRTQHTMPTTAELDAALGAICSIGGG